MLSANLITLISSIGGDVGTAVKNINNLTTRVTNTESSIVTINAELNNLPSLNADLSAIANLSGSTGLLKKVSTGNWTLDTNTYLTSVTSSQVTTALGYTPLSSITQSQVTSALANGTVSGTLTVTGNFTCNATIYASTDVVLSSDERLKTNWRDNYDTNEFITNLATVKSGVFDFVNTNQTSLGVSAQALKEVLPEAVVQDDNGFLAVRYSNAAMFAVIKLAQKVIELEAELKALKEKSN